MFMSKKAIKIVSLLLCVVCVISMTAISASAVSSKTKEMYINGYYCTASATVYSSYTSANTYSQKTSYPKYTTAFFKYYDKSFKSHTVTKGSTTYSTNNSTSLSRITSSPSDYYTTIKGYSKNGIKYGTDLYWQPTVTPS